MDNLWTRRTNSGKLSLSTAGTGGDSSSSGRGAPNSNNNASFSKRFGGDTSSHGSKTANPYNAATTPGGGLISPTGGASSAFGLGSGAFASFGSAKTPKTPGNPFDLAMANSGGGAVSTAKTPGTEKSQKEGGLSSKTVGKPVSVASLADSKATTATTTSSAAAAEAAARAAAHSLRTSWVFWFRPPITKANGYIEYEKTLHPIAGCDTAEQFFTIYKHLKRPSNLPVVSDYHLFKKGVRPIWEDDENRKGGKWIVRLKKGVADRYWEDLLLAMIGDQFGDAGEEVCGAVLSVRNGEDILSIWTRTDGGRVLKIRETMKRVLAFPPDTKVEWKSHDSSIQQRTAIEESRRDKAGSNHQHERRGNKPQQQSHDDHQKQGSSAT